MAKVLGDNAVLFFYDSGVWKLYACDRTVTLDVQTEVIETSVSGSGDWATFKPTKNSGTAQMDGVVSLNEVNKLTLPDLRQKQYTFTELLMRFQYTATDGTVYTEQGTFIITGSNSVGSYNSVSVFTIQLKLTGPLTQVFTPTVTNLTTKDMRYEYTAAGGEFGFTNGTLAGKYILVVGRDGIGNSKIILSGTPVNKEVLYTTGPGSFAWATPLEPGEEVFIVYRDI